MDRNVRKNPCARFQAKFELQLPSSVNCPFRSKRRRKFTRQPGVGLVVSHVLDGFASWWISYLDGEVSLREMSLLLLLLLSDASSILGA